MCGSRLFATCCVGVLLCALHAGCSRPQIFSRGQKIRIGSYDLTVLYPEIREFDNRRALIVHFRCEPISSEEEMTRFQHAFFTAFSVQDAAGRRYFGAPVVADAMRFAVSGIPQSERDAAMLMDSLQTEPDRSRWMVMAAVTPEAHGFSLRIRNMQRRGGQAGTAIVDLGR